MTKQDFLACLSEKLTGLPQNDVGERLRFYGEMIDDRMEEGMTEEDAVAAVGSVDEIAAGIMEDNTAPTSEAEAELSGEENTEPTADDMVPVKAEHRSGRKIKAWEILLLVLGAPIWFSLLVAAVSVAVSLYVVLWSVVVSLWAVVASLSACALYGVVAGIAFAIGESGLVGIALLGAGLACAGLFILFFCGSKVATKGTVLLTGKIARGIKNAFTRKEALS